MFIACLLTALAADSESVEPPPTPDWLERAHERAEHGPPQLPSAFSRDAISRARLGNALIPTGLAVATAASAFAIAARGTQVGIWGTGIGLGVVTSGVGLALTATALERSAVDLRIHEREPVDTTALRIGHVMAGVGGLSFVAGAALVVADVDAGLVLAASGGALVGLSSIPYAVQLSRTRWAYDRAALTVSMTPVWDPGREMAGLSLSGRF